MGLNPRRPYWMNPMDHVPFDSRGDALKAVWFHEDDYCQIELLPRVAEAFARHEAEAIRVFADAHRAPGGVGWTDLYRQKQPPASMYNLHIALDSLGECIPRTLRPFDRVVTGYGSYPSSTERTAAWGRDRIGLIFADFDEVGVVRNVWFDHFGAPFVEDVRAFLSACAARWDVILADWAWTQIVDLRDSAAVDAYLSLRAAPRE